MKTGIDVAAHCKITPANIRVAPVNSVALRPKRSDIKGEIGRACLGAWLSTRKASKKDCKLTDEAPMVWAEFIRPDWPPQFRKKEKDVITDPVPFRLDD